MPSKQAQAYKRGKRDAQIEVSHTEHCPPTWAAVISIFCEAYRNTGDTKHLAEIIRCAQLADKYVASQATPSSIAKADTTRNEAELYEFALSLLDNGLMHASTNKALVIAIVRDNPELARLLALFYYDARINGLQTVGEVYDRKALKNYDETV